MLKSDYSQEQVRKEVFTKILTESAGTLTLETIIDHSMEVYAETLLRYSRRGMQKAICSDLIESMSRTLPEYHMEMVVDYMADDI